MRRIIILAILSGFAAAVPAEEIFPQVGWKPAPNPLASPNAVPGGQVVAFGGPSPKSLNYYLDNNTFSLFVIATMYESLLEVDPITYEDAPSLAEKWAISDDKKSFTFWIKPEAKWSDGRAITAEDVKWTFETILDPKNLTGPHKVALETFETPPEILGERTIRFTNREVHWRNLGAIGGLFILPKHVFENVDFNLVNFEFPVVSGPYRLGEIKSGIYLNLERREDWWRRDAPGSRGLWNFRTIRFKMFDSRETAYETFLKGDIDIFPIYTSRIWIKETQSEKFIRNWIVKQKVTNHQPLGFQGFAMNMRKFPFDDRRVREAMACLLDRKKMNETLMYNQYFLQRSYMANAYDAENPCPNEPIPFDKQKARALLAEAGWKPDPGTGILRKNGAAFSFRFLLRDTSSARFVAIYEEDLRDVGIRLTTELKDWASWAKDMDEFNFDMTWAAWSAAMRTDPEYLWHSRAADQPNSSNITGFKSSRVDELIEKQKTIFSLRERNEILREIDNMLFHEYPYVLLWNSNYTRLLYWNKFGTPPTVLSKFSDEDSAYAYWWHDPDAAEELKDAMQTDWSLPRREFDVRFDEKFKAGKP